LSQSLFSLFPSCLIPHLTRSTTFHCVDPITLYFSLPMVVFPPFRPLTFLFVPFFVQSFPFAPSPPPHPCPSFPISLAVSSLLNPFSDFVPLVYCPNQSLTCLLKLIILTSIMMMSMNIVMLPYQIVLEVVYRTLCVYSVNPNGVVCCDDWLFLFVFPLIHSLTHSLTITLEFTHLLYYNPQLTFPPLFYSSLGLGVQQSRGWAHYAVYHPEPHVLLFRRPHGTVCFTNLII